MDHRAVVRGAALCVAWVLAGCVGGPGVGREPASQVRLLSSFETAEQMAGWSAGAGAGVERSAEHASAGGYSLRVTVPENGRTGVRYLPSPVSDWSRYTSLRMDVFYPYEDRLAVALRVEDAESTDPATRFDWDDGTLVLLPGRNEIEVSMRALASGRPGSRGLDLTRIRSLALFPLGDHPERTFYLDNVRLEALDLEAFPRVAIIDGFEEPTRLEVWQKAEGVKLTASDEHVTEGSASLRVRFAGGPEPGLSLFDLPGRNWLPYEWLALDVYNDTDDTMRGAVRVSDASAEVTVAVALRPGANRLRLPLDLFSGLHLRAVRGLTFLVSRPAPGTTLYLDNVRLRRWPVEGEPSTQSAESAETKPVTLRLDYRALASVARRTGFLANVYVEGPGRRGARLHRLRPVDKEEAEHTLDVPPGTHLVSSFFLDHDTWYLDTRTVEVTEAGASVRYEPGDFAH